MERSSNYFKRPQTAFEVAVEAEDLESFGYALRDWQHELKQFHARPEFIDCFARTPPLLQIRFSQGDIADAYLAGYVNFLADIAAIQRPAWTDDPKRIALNPWFSSSDRKRLLIVSPVQLREKNIFAVPENVVHIHPGRPKVTSAQKKEKNRLRQRRYRACVAEQLADYHRLKKQETQRKAKSGQSDVSGLD